MKQIIIVIIIFLSALSLCASDSLNVSCIGRALNDTTCIAVKDVYVQGEYAYCACDRDGLIILDVSDPTEPVEIVRFDTPGFAEAVWARDTLAFIADWNGGLRIIDVSNPTIPAEIGTTRVSERAMDVAVRGDYAYVGSRGEGLRIVDISDPLLPVDLGRPALTDAQAVRCIDFRDDYAFISGNPHYDGSIRFLDITTPASAAEIANYGSEKIVYSLAVTDSFAFFGKFMEIAVYSWDSSGLTFETTYELGTEGSWAKGLAARPPYLFAAFAYNGLQVYDITDPISSLPCVGYYDTEYRAPAVFLEDSLAYVADMEGGLYILDISSFPDVIAENDIPIKSAINIYPNPFNSTCRIISDSPVEIYSISGKLIEALDGSDGWTPGINLPSGIYLIRTKDGKQCRKAVLLR